MIIAGLLIVLAIFGPVIKEEFVYRANKAGGIKYSLDASVQFPEPGLRIIIPVDKEFGLVIPKINVNAAIYPEVDPLNPEEYLPILRKGVAHAKDSAYPDRRGNIFLFAHSTDAFYNVRQYNAVFFLIGKMEEGDEVDIFYNKERYQYEVISKEVVIPEKLGEYLQTQTNTGKKTLTLQTGYPPGTTLKRLIIIASQTEN